VFDLVSCTLESALRRLDTAEGLTVRPDQGWHYKMQPSRTGRCLRIAG
jgi:hypothetical protein